MKPIQILETEAGEAIKDPSRTIESSSMPAVLAAAIGTGVGGTASFAALYFMGTVGFTTVAGVTSGLAAAGSLVGGGMLAGFGVLLAPAAVLGVAGYAIFSQREKKKLIQTKEVLLKSIITKHDAILKEMKSRISKTEEQVKYLEALNISLTRAINDLKHDLAA